jgi:hypothetical protein
MYFPVATLCTHCGYDLDGLSPTPGTTVCPECAHAFTGSQPTPHWLYRRRWLIGLGWCALAAVGWAIMIARESSGWGQIGMVIVFSAAPGILAGLLTCISTIIGGRILTPLDIRHAADTRWPTLLVDALLVTLGTGAIGTVACYISGGIAMTVWGGYGC